MKATDQLGRLFLAVFIFHSIGLTARPKVFDHNIFQHQVYSSHSLASFFAFLIPKY